MAWQDDIRVHYPDWATDAALERWAQSRMRLSEGQKVRGSVIARAPFGVWVDIGVDHPALLLVTEMCGAKERHMSLDGYPAIGENVDAWISAIGERCEIGLSQSSQVIA
jgi:transcriptional accessory protein Tex/SPT6